MRHQRGRRWCPHSLCIRQPCLMRYLRASCRLSPHKRLRYAGRGISGAGGASAPGSAGGDAARAHCASAAPALRSTHTDAAPANGTRTSCRYRTGAIRARQVCAAGSAGCSKPVASGCGGGGTTGACGTSAPSSASGDAARALWDSATYASRGTSGVYHAPTGQPQAHTVPPKPPHAMLLTHVAPREIPPQQAQTVPPAMPAEVPLTYYAQPVQASGVAADATQWVCRLGHMNRCQHQWSIGRRPQCKGCRRPCRCNLRQKGSPDWPPQHQRAASASPNGPSSTGGKQRAGAAYGRRVGHN